MLALLAVPVWLGGLDASSGFVSFAGGWSTNSALFPVLERATSMLFAMIGTVGMPAGHWVRLAAALAIGGLASYLAWHPLAGVEDLLRRAYALVTALVLLSPAQFPWYVLWVLPIAVLHHGYTWLVASAVMPIYYLSFHFLARGTYADHAVWITWVIWAPVWLACWHDWSQGRFTSAVEPAQFREPARAIG